MLALFSVVLLFFTGCTLDAFLAKLSPIIQPNYIVGVWGNNSTVGNSTSVWTFTKEGALTIIEKRTDGSGTFDEKNGSYIGGTNNLLKVRFDDGKKEDFVLEFITTESILIRQSVELLDTEGHKFNSYRDYTLNYLSK